MPLRPVPRPKGPRVGRPGGRFTQSRRLDKLRSQLEAHTAGFTLEQMAGILRVSTRAVRRYLNELKQVTELEAVPIAPGDAKMWRIKPSERGRTVALRRGQAYGLLAGRRIFEMLRGSALFDEIDLALRLVEQVAHRPTTRTAVRGDVAAEARLEDRFAYLPAVSRSYAHRSEDVDAAFQAVADLTVLRFRYREADAEGKGARIKAHPYALLLHGGAITCLARDVDRATTRAFWFDRMSELVASEVEHFEMPADFALDDWLQGDFGVARAARNVRVMVEFDPRVADAVKARKVHPSQRVAVARDGRVRASFAVPDSLEVLARLRAWLLGFGSAARVLEPQELVDDVAAELRRAAARYA
jgi:predicted DNA-binding transcriptional regulator YafY